MGIKIDLTGQRFGRLTIVSEKGRTRNGHLLWYCKCDCGGTVNIITSSITNDNTRSCGCLRKDLLTTHGMTNTSERNAWDNMKDRCNKSNDPSYARYGGRGILVCNRWLESFENFYADMGPRPSPDHSIDRKNNDGHYTPNNCKWSTRVEQCNNRRNNVIVTYKDKDYTIAELAKEYNIRYGLLYKRLKRDGWSVKDALEIPVALY